MSDIRAWLEDLGLGQYVDSFEENEVGLELLSRLDDGRLKDLGVGPIGHRIRILDAISARALVGEKSVTRPASPAVRPELGKASESGAERRQLTVMFCDLVGSTAWAERLDPEDLRKLMAAYQRSAGAVVARYDGHVAQYLGDGILVYFGWPVAHEDDAERAIRCGLELIRAVKGIGAPEPLQLRVGIATGPVVVGETGHGDAAVPGAAVGETPNVAKRLQDFAGPDEVVIADSTYELVPHHFELERIGKRRVKGIKRAMVTWRVIAARQTESRFDRRTKHILTPFVGRSAEMRRLQRLWADAVKGRGRIAVVSGEPGIGKSRLVTHFRKSLHSTPHSVLLYQCSPLDDTTPFAPVIHQIRHAAHITRNDRPKEALSKARELLRQAVPDPTPLLPYYGAVLSIPACDGYLPADLGIARERERAMGFFVDVTIALSRQNPVLVILEDIQWIDPSTLTVTLEFLSRVLANAVLCVMTCRNECPVELADDLEVAHLRLSRLSAEQSRVMILGFVKDAQLPSFLIDRLIKQTDGIPLMIEELTRVVLESGALRRVGNRLKIRDTLPEPLLPTTIRDSLMERLDRLGDAKRVAQHASVFGRQFSLDGVGQICPLALSDVRRGLQRLEEARLIRSRRGDRPATYEFSHAMLQEAAYASLLIQYKTELHKKVADWFAKRSPIGANEQTALLAHHFTHAGISDKAVVFWLKAGRAALRASAHREAIARLTEGIRVLASWGDHEKARRLETELQLHLAMSYIALEGWSGPHVDSAYNRALELSLHNGTLRQRSMAMWGVSRSQMVATRFGASLKMASNHIRLAAEAKKEDLALMAHTAALTTNFYRGNLSAAAKSVDFVCAHYRAGEHRKLVERYQHDPKVVALVFGGHIYWIMGQPNKGRAFSEEARILARDISHPFMLALAYIVGGADFRYDHDVKAAWTCLEAGLKYAREYGLSAYETFAPLWMIEAVVAHDPSKSTLTDLEQRIDKLLQYKIYLTVPFYQTCLALEFLRHYDLDRAETLLDDAERIMSRTKEYWFKPELYRVRAELAARRAGPESSEAGVLFERSLVEARKMKALGWELRTVLSYGRHQREARGACPGRSILGDLVKTFGAGESSAELDEARQLLS